MISSNVVPVSLVQLEFIEERYSMLKTNSEAFRKEASAASEKSRNLQVANSKIQATLDSISQVIINVASHFYKIRSFPNLIGHFRVPRLPPLQSESNCEGFCDGN